MRASPFTCPRCLMALAVVAFGLRTASRAEAYQRRPRRRDLYHRASKMGPITKMPQGDDGNIRSKVGGVELLKRADEACLEGYYLCGESLGGNCCPDQYACATDSCYATTQDPRTWTCAGTIGWYPCGFDVGGKFYSSCSTYLNSTVEAIESGMLSAEYINIRIFPQTNPSYQGDAVQSDMCAQTEGDAMHHPGTARPAQMATISVRRLWTTVVVGRATPAGR